jgi:biopolymer transport protein ExbD
MAMGGPSGGGGGEGEGDADGAIFADINITPLTDIFLVLLIIFMVTTTAITEAGADKGGFKVTLPKGGKGDAVAAQDLSIAILSDGRVVIGGKVVDEQELRSMLTASAEKNPNTLVLVQADEGVIHGRVVAVMDLARRLGLQRLAIATRGENGK